MRVWGGCCLLSRKAALFNISMQTRAWIMRCIYEDRVWGGWGRGGSRGLHWCSAAVKRVASFSHGQPDTKQPLSPPGSCHTANIYIQRKKKNVSQLCKLTSCPTRQRAAPHAVHVVCLFLTSSPPFVFKRCLLALKNV